VGGPPPPGGNRPSTHVHGRKVSSLVPWRCCPPGEEQAHVPLRRRGTRSASLGKSRGKGTPFQREVNWVLPAPVLTPPLVAAHHQQGAKRASTVFDAIIARERGVAVRGHPYVLMLRSPSGSRSAENLSGRGQSFAVATDIRRSGSTTFGRKWSPRVRNSNSRINTPPFVSEASSRDPFAFSTLRQPRCMKLMALVCLMVTL